MEKLQENVHISCILNMKAQKHACFHVHVNLPTFALHYTAHTLHSISVYSYKLREKYDYVSFPV